MPWSTQKKRLILIKNAPELKDKRDFVIEFKILINRIQANKKNGDNLMLAVECLLQNDMKMESSRRLDWIKDLPTNL